MKQGPKYEKFMKVHRMKKLEKTSNNYPKIQYNYIGLQAINSGRLTYNELFAGYKVLKKIFKKDIAIKVNASCVYGITQKKKESRMGKGKGSRYMWVCNVQKGMILYEVNLDKYLFYLVKKKLLKHLWIVNDKLSIVCRIKSLKY